MHSSTSPRKLARPLPLRPFVLCFPAPARPLALPRPLLHAQGCAPLEVVQPLDEIERVYAGDGRALRKLALEAVVQPLQLAARHPQHGHEALARILNAAHL